jgi:Fe-S-cluster-containing hydrogenase component 2
MGVLLITPEKCTDCRACELACSLSHEEEFNPARSRVAVLAWDRGAHTVPIMCLQCEEAGCMAICPAKAITEDRTSGARLVNGSKCITCRMCVHICPFGSTYYDVKGRKILKCDLCSGDPVCAKVCTSGAIVYGERSTANIDKRQQAARKLKAIVRGAKQP